MLYGKTIENELVKFEPDAMRAFVKYKILKKLIGQCIDRREAKKGDTTEAQDTSLVSDKDLEIEALAMTKFIEDLIEDVIAINKYYNTKYTAIDEEYLEIQSSLESSIRRRRSIFQKRGVDPAMFTRIRDLLGEMLLLQYFGTANYSGIRKIIKKFRKVTLSAAVDGVMTIINQCPFYSITTQNEQIDRIINLFYLYTAYDNELKLQKLCCSHSGITLPILEKEAEGMKSVEAINQLRDICMNTIIDRNQKMPGKESLRDVVFRGRRVLKSRIPKRIQSDTEASSDSAKGVTNEADTMLIQMAFFAIPPELYVSSDGEVLDSSETILWEGYLYRRYSALSAWKKRYVITSNKRICLFDTQYGALKKSILLPTIASVYNGQTYRYSQCLIMTTEKNEFFWFASDDPAVYSAFFSILKEIVSHLLLTFRKNDTVNSNNNPSYGTNTLKRLKKDRIGTVDTSVHTESNSKKEEYVSVTNLFGESILNMNKENDVKALDKKAEIVENSVLLPILEDKEVEMKTTSLEIRNSIYSCRSMLDVWSMLQRFDNYVSSKVTIKDKYRKEDTETVKERNLIIKKREISKIIECIQECEASHRDLWPPTLCLLAASILKHDYPDQSMMLQGKESIHYDAINPIRVNIKNVYRYERQIGEGHYSSVWIVENKNDHLFYALKKVPKYTLSKYEKEALSKEVANMMILRGQENIVKVFGFFDDEYNMYITMELAPGGRLFDYIKQRKQFTEQDAQAIVKKLVMAIDYCHKNGVVHRDLKPQNILLMDANDITSIKLTDFGFSSSIDSGELKTSLGTPGYTAPEVLRSQPYNDSVDLWSIGVIIYILLCGYPPFPSNNDIERLKTICQGKYEFYSPEWDNISNEAKDIIRHLLVVNPKDRYTTQQCIQHTWLQKNNLDLVNLPSVISGITHIQQKYALRFKAIPQSKEASIRTHLCRTTQDVSIYTTLDTHGTSVFTIPSNSPLEVGNEVWSEGIQYAALTERTIQYYHIPEKGRYVAIQSEEQLYCIHTLTYSYKRIGNAKECFIYTTPLDTSHSVGVFDKPLLICDTLLVINHVQWGIIHHMMYDGLKLAGIPQAWVMIEDERTKYFIKEEVSKDFEAKLRQFNGV